MFEGRDETLPRASEVLGHFKRNITQNALNQLRDAFKATWSAPIQITNPLDFAVSVEFGRVLPDDARKAVESELALHGWENFVLKRDNKEGIEQHVLVVKLKPDEASKYA